MQPAKTTAAALFGAGDQWLREAPASAGGLPPATQDLLAIAQRVGRGAVLLRARTLSLEYTPPRKNKKNTFMIIYDSCSRSLVSHLLSFELCKMLILFFS